MKVVDENESAFAVYAGKVSPSKVQKKKKKNKEKINDDIPLNKMAKIDIIRKKKEKKNKILSKANKNSTLASPPEKKIKKILLSNDSNSQAKNKLKKKKKKKKQSLETDQSYISNESANNQGLVPSESDTSAILPSISGAYSLVNKDGKTNRKKVQIAAELPIFEKSEMMKAVVSTPRFKRKQETPQRSGSKSKPKVLNAVDSYIESKKSKIDSPRYNRGDKNSAFFKTLAGEAKMKAEKQGSVEAFGEATLQKILEPVSVNTFLRNHWEKKPIHIPGRKDKFSSFISTEMIDTVLRDSIVLFGKHLDVTTYTDGKRETHNPEGRAHAHVVWDYFSTGCSIRLLNPQFFMNTIHLLNSHLQELFGCFVGANVYLTPPNSQGFAPHYDDIEAIILQVEGTKIWRIYSPINKNEYLPRFSSPNFTEEEVGDPIMEVVLKAGDVLYFPRGFIHQARTEDQHSLHITLSTYQQTSWFDLIQKVFQSTLMKASSQDIEFRKGLPLGYLESGGLAYKNPNQNRKSMVNNLKELFKRMADHLDVDEAVDQMGLKFMQEALPPVLTSREAACSVFGGGLRMGENGKLSHHISFRPDTRIRWIRKYCFRIVEEEVSLENDSVEKQIRIYYTLDNSREYRKEEPQYLIIERGVLPGVLHLVAAYPEYTKLSDLLGELEEDTKINLVGDLWDHGLLMTDVPLESSFETEGNMEAKEDGLSKEETEVMTDLLDTVPHGFEDHVSSSDSDGEGVTPGENGHSSSESEDLAQPIPQDLESDADPLDLG